MCETRPTGPTERGSCFLNFRHKHGLTPRHSQVVDRGVKTFHRKLGRRVKGILGATEFRKDLAAGHSLHEGIGAGKDKGNREGKDGGANDKHGALLWAKQDNFWNW